MLSQLCLSPSFAASDIIRYASFSIVDTDPRDTASALVVPSLDLLTHFAILQFLLLTLRTPARFRNVISEIPQAQTSAEMTPTAQSGPFALLLNYLISPAAPLSLFHPFDTRLCAP
jgi:hypothetical protein